MVKKGQKATKLDMDKIKEALAEGLGAPAIAAKFQYSTSSVSKAVKRIRGTPKERKVGSGRKATGDKSEEIEAILSQDPNKSVSENSKSSDPVEKHNAPNFAQKTWIQAAKKPGRAETDRKPEGKTPGGLPKLENAARRRETRPIESVLDGRKAVQSGGDAQRRFCPKQQNLGEEKP